MKILRLFDSLKFLRTIFVAVVAIFAFAPAYADDDTQYVWRYTPISTGYGVNTDLVNLTESDENFNTYTVKTTTTSSQRFLYIARTKTLPAKHKYFFNIRYKSDFNPYFRYNLDGNYTSIGTSCRNNTWCNTSKIITPQQNLSLSSSNNGLIASGNDRYVEGKTITIDKSGFLTVFDLTEIFGAGNEPTTVAAAIRALSIDTTIKIATTKYNEQQFAPVERRLDAAVAAVDTVVSQTMTQAQQIDDIANNKQTRPDEGCTAKYCLLVEDENGTSHWYPIAGANGVEYVLPAGYTQLTYIQSDGRQVINTGYVLQETDSVEVDYKLTDLTRTGDKFILGAQTVSSASDASVGNFWVETYDNTNNWYVRYGSGKSANTYGSVTPTSQLSGTLAVSKNSFVVNGVEILKPNFVSMPVRPMTIFNRISLDGSIANNGASAQISEVRVKNGNNLVHKYVPVRNSNNELGMYDLMDSNPATAFYTNAGTGTFTAGPDM